MSPKHKTLKQISAKIKSPLVIWTSGVEGINVAISKVFPLTLS